MTARIPDLALGVDQASVSGYGLRWIGGAYIEHGLARSNKDRTKLLDRIRALIDGDMARLLVMFEDHTKMPLTRLTRFDRKTKRTHSRQGAPEKQTATIIGMGDARGRWREKLEDLGHSKMLRDAIEPRIWRARLGVRGRDSEALKRDACRWATQRLGQPITNHNHAEGVCLTEFCAFDGVARLEQRRAKARSRLLASKARAAQLSLDVDELGDDDEEDDVA